MFSERGGKGLLLAGGDFSPLSTGIKGGKGFKSCTAYGSSPPTAGLLVPLSLEDPVPPLRPPHLMTSFGIFGIVTAAAGVGFGGGGAGVLGAQLILTTPGRFKAVGGTVDL